jgi:hypothetical protein
MRLNFNGEVLNIGIENEAKIINSSRDEYMHPGNTYGPSPMLRTQDSMEDSSPSRSKSDLQMTTKSQINLRS